MNRRGDIPKLSVIMPLYNEKGTITEILNRVLEVPVDKEIIIVDDGSTDGTAEILKAISEESIRVIFHERNLGKGCAIRTALQHARGTLIIIQDGDL
ncbi:MAG TPA: glycosyltransferase family 2 protein, partial [Candidatus Binatia bacterium]|nr:glycosyltransferase family 2 protein [Candidatus Binatia bacterium]